MRQEVARKKRLLGKGAANPPVVPHAEPTPDDIMGNLDKVEPPPISAKARTVLSLLGEPAMTPTVACRTARLEYGRFKKLITDHPEYALLCEQARAKGSETRALKKIADSDDWRAQAKLLSMLRPEEFADQTGHGNGPSFTVQIAIGNPTTLQPGEQITIEHKP